MSRAPSALTIAIARSAFVALLLGLWIIGSSIYGSAVLPSPLEVVATMFQGFHEGWLIRATLVTLSEVLPAFAIAAIAGAGLGVALGLAHFWGDVLEPMILGVYSIPKITLYPIFLVLFKLGIASKVAFGFFHGVFPIEILTQGATSTISPTYLKVARTLNLTPWQTAAHVVIPAIVPAMAVGLRLAFSLTFIGVILAEMSASRAGLGFLLNAADSTFDSRRTLAVIVVLAIIGIGTNLVFYALERRVSPARPEARQATLAM
ncbi:ABC transporter permease subunit [bacterium]|nr:MAG: ABC transporter permease subunit [bacterium]